MVAGRSLTDDVLSPRQTEVASLVAAGLSNEAIAARLHLSVKTVEKNITAIYAKLGVRNRVQLAGLMRGSEPPSRRGNLHAPLTPFIGRVRELEEINARLVANRLVALVGPGGTGKSRLALEIARRTGDRFAAGSWFVSLAELRETDAVAAAIAEALALPPGAFAALAGWLAPRDLLLLLDNCEHLDGVGRIVRALLDAAPQLRVIATSRERLGIFGENVVRVAPMDPRDAVVFFADRAAAAGADVDAGAAAAVCERLDGVPLAIELAAARLHDLPLDRLAAALERRLPVLDSADVGIAARHRSIDALVDWGYLRLTEAERFAFRYLGVFAGTFGVDAAARVAGDAGRAAVPTLLRAALVDRTPAGTLRLLQPVRDVALTKLRAHGETERAFTAFARAYQHLVADAAERWYTTPIATWLPPLRAERHNILAAIHWSLIDGNDVTGGARLTADAARIWSELAREPELDRYLAVALERVPADDAQLLAQLWIGVAKNLDVARAGAAAVDAAHRALAYATAAGDALTVALAHLAVGASHAGRDDAAAARPHLTAALAAFRQRGLQRSTAAALTALAIVSPDRRVELFEEVLAAARALRDPLLEGITLSNLAVCYRHRAEFGEARRLARQSIAIFASVEAPMRLARAHLGAARIETAAGDAAAALAHAADAFRLFDELAASAPRAESAHLIASLLDEREPFEAAAWRTCADEGADAGALLGRIDAGANAAP